MPTEKGVRDFLSVSLFSFLSPKHKVKLPVKLNKNSVREAQRIKTNKQASKKRSVVWSIANKKKSLNEKTYWNRFRRATVKEKLKKKLHPREKNLLVRQVTSHKALWVRLALRKILCVAANKTASKLCCKLFPCLSGQRKKNFKQISSLI